MKYEILGPLRVIDSNGVSVISAPKIELLLAVLLIRVDRLISADQLIIELWNDKPPRRVTAGLHVYISQLRKFLNRPSESSSTIITKPSGYLLSIGTDELDLSIFLELVEQGRRLAHKGAHEEAVSSFERALRLWHGAALGDLPPGPIVVGFLRWLEEKRLECIELTLESHLQLGRHREMIAELYSLIAEFPFNEAFYRQLILALYRSERQADALWVYQQARDTLNRELGIEPSRSLQDLHQAILTADHRLDLGPSYLTSRIC